MARSNKPELLLGISTKEGNTGTWALDPPQGNNSFRIVVRIGREQSALPKPRSWFSYLGALGQAMLAVFFWRSGH